MKRERLDFLADNPLYTKRFSFYVGRRCRNEAVKDVARDLHLDWHAVKELDKQYMRAQLARVGTPAPKVIGIDEISIGRKPVTFRIVVSDLIRRRPIWFGGQDRTEVSMAEFYDWLGPSRRAGIRLAVMDMWKPFYNVTTDKAPQAAILYDKFHVIRHLNDALPIFLRFFLAGYKSDRPFLLRFRRSHQFPDGIEHLLELGARVARKGIVLHRQCFSYRASYFLEFHRI